MNKPTVIGYMKEQPAVLQAVLKNRSVFVDPVVEIFQKNEIKKVLFFGSGTSYNISHIAAYYFKQILNIDAVAHYPTVFKNYEKADWTGTLKNEQILFVGISQSGTSVSTVDVMKHAKDNGYQTLALTGNLQSEITKHVDTSVHLLVGDELTPPETKGYTVSVISIYLWAIAIAKALGIYDEKAYEKAILETQELVDNFQTVIDESEVWYDRNKASIVNSDRVYVLGYGVDYGSALEGMLKIGEMLRVPTVGYELEEFSHG
ncbi:MAG: SIS domain-containing protein, partial [Herbinix sp.]|nr:SIS domain-containing protein [Herbinix sp.]